MAQYRIGDGRLLVAGARRPRHYNSSMFVETLTAPRGEWETWSQRIANLTNDPPEGSSSRSRGMSVKGNVTTLKCVGFSRRHLAVYIRPTI
jgi:hypothetical protein